MLSRSHALLRCDLSCKLETAKRPSVRLFTATTAAGRHVAVLHISFSLLWAHRVPMHRGPYHSQVRGTVPGSSVDENSWPGAHGVMQWSILVSDTLKSLEIKRCTLLLREKPAFLSRNQLNFLTRERKEPCSCAAPVGEEHFHQA